MFCSISGNPVEKPVVSRKTGHLFEESLIEKYLENEGKCPITDEEMTKDDLLPVQTIGNNGLHSVKPRTAASTSIPGILGLLHNEWDSLMLETFTLKKHLDSTRKELSHALYQHDAACRVIARLIKERDDAREQVIQIEKRLVQSKDASQSEDMDDAMQLENVIPDNVLSSIQEKSKELSKYRKHDRQISPSLKTVEDIERMTLQSSHTLHKSDKPGVLCLAINPHDTTLLVSGGVDKQAKVFNTSTGKVMSTLTSHSKKINQVEFHPHADIIFSASSDKTAKIWNRKDQQYTLAHTLLGHMGAVTGCSIHATGDYLATSSEDNSWGFFDVRTGKLLNRVTGENDEYSCIDFHPDGAILATGTKGNVIRIWDMNSQNNVATFEGHIAAVNSLSFSENGYHMVSGGQDGLVRFWDLRKLKNFYNIEMEKAGPVHSVSFEFNGTYLGVGASDVRIYKEAGKKAWELVRTFDDHSATVTNVKLAKDLEFIVSSSMDRSMKIFS